MIFILSYSLSSVLKTTPGDNVAVSLVLISCNKPALLYACRNTASLTCNQLISISQPYSLSRDGKRLFTDRWHPARGQESDVVLLLSSLQVRALTWLRGSVSKFVSLKLASRVESLSCAVYEPLLLIYPPSTLFTYNNSNKHCCIQLWNYDGCLISNRKTKDGFMHWHRDPRHVSVQLLTKLRPSLLWTVFLAYSCTRTSCCSFYTISLFLGWLVNHQCTKSKKEGYWSEIDLCTTLRHIQWMHVSGGGL